MIICVFVYVFACLLQYAQKYVWILCDLYRRELASSLRCKIVFFYNMTHGGAQKKIVSIGPNFREKFLTYFYSERRKTLEKRCATKTSIL